MRRISREKSKAAEKLRYPMVFEGGIKKTVRKNVRLCFWLVNKIKRVGIEKGE